METMMRKQDGVIGVSFSEEVLENSGLTLEDDLEAVSFKGGITIRKKKKSFRDIARPLIDAKGWKFDREEANERI